jgi:hypothetical protein
VTTYRKIEHHVDIDTPKGVAVDSSLEPLDLFLSGPEPLITILSGLELEVEISTAGIYRNSLHSFLDADEVTSTDATASAASSQGICSPDQMRRTRSGIVHAGWGLRLIRIDGSSDPERELRWFRESRNAHPFP